MNYDTEKAIVRIANALERIAFSLELPERQRVADLLDEHEARWAEEYNESLKKLGE